MLEKLQGSVDEIRDSVNQIRDSVDKLQNSKDNGLAKLDETLEDRPPSKRVKIETYAPNQTRTPAQDSILLWPSIKELTTGTLAEYGIEDVNKYPLCFEERRELLPLQGRGKGSESIPDYSEANVWSLVESFKENILIMHPIMMPGHLDIVVTQFLTHMARSKPKPHNSRSTIQPKEDDRLPSPVRKIIVLIVLALGKVCQHRETMRDNDSTPGLEYMAAASISMGGHRGGWTVEHAQMLILTALYYDQLGRVVESNFYLMDADRALQIIMHCDLEQFKNVQDNMAVKDMSIVNMCNNIVLLIYWTCLLLER
ncbi:hypothetical protein ColTof4_01231 [Colletotrichum tofieldiae]|nr:hypothetical protein ColTof4_01231 [Colletotrichum tofieldiae]